MRLRAHLTAALAAILLGAGPAAALPEVEVDFAWGQDPGALTSLSDPLGPEALGESENPDGTVSYLGSEVRTGWTLSWDVKVKEDPFIIGTFAVVNSSAFTQNYVISFLLPITPTVEPSSLTGASVAATLTDTPNSTNGATLGQIAGGAVFSTYIDGVLYDTLLNSSLSIPFASGTTSDFFGLPGTTQPGPPGFTSIGIQIAFSLTPGDQASFTSFFEIVPIPEPVTALMLGGGLVGLAVFGRKRD